MGEPSQPTAVYLRSESGLERPAAKSLEQKAEIRKSLERQKNMEALQAQVQAMMLQMQGQETRTAAMVTEIERLRVVEQQAAASAAAATPIDQVQQQILQQQAALLTQLTTAATTRETRQRPMLVDTKGLGKPSNFQGNEEKFLPWKIRMENYIVNVFPDMAPVLTWAEEHEEPSLYEDITTAFGDDQDVDYVEEVGDKQQQITVCSRH